jgi:hypothetical protein
MTDPASYRAGTEAAEKVAHEIASRPGLPSTDYHDGRKDGAWLVAAAIRALPVPDGEVTETEATKVYGAFVEALHSLTSPTAGDAIASMRAALRAARGLG